jgi:creatinine amidohydrolase
MEICARAAAISGAFCAPPLWYGHSPSHADFPGTVSLAAGTLASLVRDVAAGLAGSGFGRVILLSGHGGNRGPVLCGLSEAASCSPGASFRYFGYWDLPGAAEEERRIFGGPTGWHASAAEVSMYMHMVPSFRPEAGAMKAYPPSPAAGEVLSPSAWRSRYPDGPAGVDVSMIDPERGGEYLSFLSGALASVIAPGGG